MSTSSCLLPCVPLGLGFPKRRYREPLKCRGLATSLSVWTSVAGYILTKLLTNQPSLTVCDNIMAFVGDSLKHGFV